VQGPGHTTAHNAPTRRSAMGPSDAIRKHVSSCTAREKAWRDAWHEADARAVLNDSGASPGVMYGVCSSHRTCGAATPARCAARVRKAASRTAIPCTTPSAARMSAGVTSAAADTRSAGLPSVAAERTSAGWSGSMHAVEIGADGAVAEPQGACCGSEVAVDGHCGAAGGAGEGVVGAPAGVAGGPSRACLTRWSRVSVAAALRR